MFSIKLRNFTFFAFVFALSLFLAGCDLLDGNQNSQTEQAPAETTTDTEQGSDAADAESAATVTISASGASPVTVTVKAGESITWINNTNAAVKIASDDHPTHKINPELTGGQFVIDIPAGESKTISAGTKVGSWGWHDHAKPSVVGTVVVE